MGFEHSPVWSWVSQEDTWVVQVVNDVFLAFSWVPTWMSWCCWLSAVNMWLILAEPLFMTQGTAWQGHARDWFMVPAASTPPSAGFSHNACHAHKARTGISLFHPITFNPGGLWCNALLSKFSAPQFFCFEMKDSILFQSWFPLGIITRTCRNSQNRSWKVFCINMKRIKGQ